MLKLCCALGAVGAAAYTAPLARHRRLALRTPSARRATNEWTGSDVDPWNPISEDRVFEVCYLDEAGEHIEECVCESEAELIEKGLVPPRRGKDNSDLLFAVPNSGADGETLFSLADYETCLADDVCEVSDEIVDKAYGPGALERSRPRAARRRLPRSPRRKRLDFMFILARGAWVWDSWEQLFANSEEIDVSVNGEVKMKGAQVLAAHERPPETVPATSLVFGASSEDLASLLSRATSFSCSLGAAMRRVMTYVKKLRKRRQFDPSYESATDRVYSGDLSPEKDPRPVLYCAENDHESVARLKRELRTRVRVVDCMVDRVCTGFDPRYVPFAPSVATLPESLRHADYLSERKFSLVNGMHTVVAFLTLDYMYNPVDPGGREYVLIKYSKMRRAEQRKVEAWRTARIARLIEQFGIESIMRWEGADNVVEVWNSLLAFGDEVLTERFSAVDDLVSRVLGGGVANRYETRLKPTVKWLTNRQPDALSAFFLHAARWDRAQAAKTETTSLEAPIQSAAEAEAFVRDTCSELLKRGKRFCNKELEITHKQLIREQRQFGGKKFAPLVVDAIAEDKARAVAILQERRLKRKSASGDARGSTVVHYGLMRGIAHDLHPDVRCFFFSFVGALSIDTHKSY
ncbi:unnamed protein product [Pelagomonas calceolata]|uniref:Uncharacterized protein n=1 Tax=Pelagomonas calceolata TaxID=35677 RepID=A0A8J2X096_9STRA|nr:unnamed protein product [Pelagomonas calceolata]